MILQLRLRAKITLGTLAILLLCIVVTGTIFVHNERQRLEMELRQRGEALAVLVAQFCTMPIKKYSFFIVEEVARTVEKLPGITYCEIYDSKNFSLVQVDATVRGKQVQKQKPQRGSGVLVIKTPIQFESEVLGTVEIGLYLEPVKEAIRSFTIRLGLAALVAMILVGVGISLFLHFNFINPVVHLSGVVKKMGKGDFVVTKIAKRKDEIGDLSRSFSIMSSNLKQLYGNLEKKVEERTAELARMNRQLQREIKVRQQAERDLNKAKEGAEQANKYKSNFIANMSHEIRTPLNAILGYAQILQSRSSLDYQTLRAVEAIDRSGSHLLELINDILDFSKIEAGKMELKPTSFDLCLLIRNMSSMFHLRCMEKSLTWQVVGIDVRQIVPVKGDAGKLRQILINLLGNAVKFTEKGGVVLRITTEPNSMYRFCIEDSGPGIAEEFKAQLFKPFSNIGSDRNKEGTGLGLSISSRFLEMMGGSLELLPNKPSGTRFCFSVALPFAPETSLPETNPTHKINGLLSEETITSLIVDDDNLSRTVLSALLNKCDIATIEASNGLEALNMLETEWPDIIFMDRYMPQMDGPETIKAIDRKYGSKAPPIVMITAAAFETSEEGAGVENVTDTLIKPCEISDVLKTMARVLGLEPRMQQTIDDNVVDEPDPPLSPADLMMPSMLHENMMSAVEFGRISELKRLLKEIEENEVINPALLLALQKRLTVYDLEEIKDLLNRVADHRKLPKIN